VFLHYFLYILRCSDDTLYTGITTDIQRRLEEHNSSAKGAKYTRSRRPVALVYTEEFEDRSSASKREYIIKRLSRAKKLALINARSKEE
jgi:putative endonuclease